MSSTDFYFSFLSKSFFSSSDNFFDGYFPSALFDVSTLRRQRLLDDADDGPVDDLDDGDEADADAETQDTANLENDIAPKKWCHVRPSKKQLVKRHIVKTKNHVNASKIYLGTFEHNLPNWY